MNFFGSGRDNSSIGNIAQQNESQYSTNLSQINTPFSSSNMQSNNLMPVGTTQQPITKAQELLTVLDNIENSYNPSSQLYKFTHVFYNIVNTPIERPLNFPQDLWNKYYIPNSSLMPVLLNKKQIDERKAAQRDLETKLSESRNGILKQLESLRFKKEMVKNKLEGVVVNFRKKTRKYIFCREENTNVYKLQTDVLTREKLMIREQRDEVLRYITKLKLRLEGLEKKVSEALHLSEKQIGLARQLDKRH